MKIFQKRRGLYNKIKYEKQADSFQNKSICLAVLAAVVICCSIHKGIKGERGEVKKEIDFKFQ